MAKKFAEIKDGWALAKRGPAAVAIKVAENQTPHALGARVSLGVPYQPISASRVAFRSFVDGIEKMRHGNNPPLSYIFEQYVKRHEKERFRGASPKYNWARLSYVFGALGALDVTEDHCKAYAIESEGVGRAPWTIHTDLNMLRTVLRWAYESLRVIDRDVTGACWNIAVPKSRQLVISPDDFWAWYDEAVHAHTKLFLLLALLTAQRKTAITELRWEHVDFDRKILDFTAAMVGKRSILDKSFQKARAVVHMGPTLLAALREAKEKARTPWVLEYQGRRAKYIYDGVNAARAAADLPKEITPHVLRHSAATWAKTSGLDLETVARMTGHKDERVLKNVYVHEDKAARAAGSEKAVAAVEAKLGRMRVVK